MKTLADAIEKAKDPLAKLLILGAGAMYIWAEERRFDRMALERWDDEGGLVDALPDEKCFYTGCRRPVVARFEMLTSSLTCQAHLDALEKIGAPIRVTRRF